MLPPDATLSVQSPAVSVDANTLPDGVGGVLLSGGQIAGRVNALGAAISRDYAEKGVGEITVIAVANGAVIFAADLLRAIRLRVRFDMTRIASYHDATAPTAQPQFLFPWRLELKSRHVLLVDDILDTGNTLAHLHKSLLDQCPASLRTCVLLDKKSRRQTPFDAEYTGFEIADVFVVGYGLDFAEHYRNLPFVGTLKPEYQSIVH
ncbi:MAG: hypoxanthine phosphoribosyltransferase [Puniceicoccales bacterium]|jgi:hypoxanthine phosphoribosyltransferase|nr:hypoxanthine phosphoribosyltransferase [Puniceicoccales bacterium]